jgi:hypothetical protein
MADPIEQLGESGGGGKVDPYNCRTLIHDTILLRHFFIATKNAVFSFDPQTLQSQRLINYYRGRQLIYLASVNKYSHFKNTLKKPNGTPYTSEEVVEEKYSHQILTETLTLAKTFLHIEEFSGKCDPSERKTAQNTVDETNKALFPRHPNPIRPQPSGLVAAFHKANPYFATIERAYMQAIYLTPGQLMNAINKHPLLFTNPLQQAAYWHNVKMGREAYWRLYHSKKLNGSMSAEQKKAAMYGALGVDLQKGRLRSSKNQAWQPNPISVVFSPSQSSAKVHYDGWTMLNIYFARAMNRLGKATFDAIKSNAFGSAGTSKGVGAGMRPVPVLVP